MHSLAVLRSNIRASHLADEGGVIKRLQTEAGIAPDRRERITRQAGDLVRDIRADDSPGMMEVFLAEYGLSTDEGVALMCLAEALLRVPDAATIDDLIEDKIAPSPWSKHLGQSSSALVNASTWALMLTGKVLDESSASIAGILHGTFRRLGEPVIRAAVRRALHEMGNQFVLGETISAATTRATVQEKSGFTYSYDMLGEAALTANDAANFYSAYDTSIRHLAAQANSSDIAENPGISIKLSALHPRYEVGQKQRVLTELAERTLSLALIAKESGIGLNIDAEEADRLDLSIDVIEAVLRDERLAGWHGFGVVVQAYGKRAAPVIDWLYALSEELDRKIMVRLVKGAYWDTEIKRAQVEGLDDFPVFTRKSSTDVSYICCAKQLLEMTDRIYPQFATHNAQTVCAILELADNSETFEFQRLHGMGEALYRKVLEKHGTRCRIYAPVGEHRDLLAYLARRLLENGANSSFVNQIINDDIPVAQIAEDPFDVLAKVGTGLNPHICRPADLFAPERKNSRGFDLHNEDDVIAMEKARVPFEHYQWNAAPLMAAAYEGGAENVICNPAKHGDRVGTVLQASAHDVKTALDEARSWASESPQGRAAVLNRAADLYEQNLGELFAALTREAGKTPMDAIAELREAVDFLRYYAARIDELGNRKARGLFACISPWNFPLAIFTGQISAALAAGCGVLAKPAEPTNIVATIAAKLLHQAGVPREVLQLLPGRGSVIGALITSDPRINGVCFTGSTATAQTVNRTIARHLEPGAALIAETGGLNAMIVDSTALPEQAVKDIIQSSFQSAGQRCSALRILYLQEDIAETFKEMLFGAMDELVVGDPWALSTDVGPVISEAARSEIADYIEVARGDGRIIKQLSIIDGGGTFVAPTVIDVSGIEDLDREIFGPVLHIATFKASEIDRVIADINAAAYGLTFGLHTRIDDRVKRVMSELNVGNMYINRNQIGAIVGSQPFGGEGLSGTGPKAGGPRYVSRFTKAAATNPAEVRVDGITATASDVQELLDTLALPKREVTETRDMDGPTGESNRLSLLPRGTVLCLGPTPEIAAAQARIAHRRGCTTLTVVPGATEKYSISGFLRRSDLTLLRNFHAVALWSEADDQRQVRIALAERDGPLLPLLLECDMDEQCSIERHVCIDTTAAGGNATLLAKSG